MRRPRSALRVVCCGALAGTFVLVQTAAGQDGGPAGLRLVIDYSAGIEVDSNKELSDPSEGTYSALVNGFEVALLSNTRTETFSLSFGSDLRLESDPDDPTTSGYELDWAEPAFRLQYSKVAANARFGVTASLRTRDVDTLEPFFVDLDGDTIIDETGFEAAEGTLTETGATVTLETGIYAPIGTTYTLGYQARTYSDTDRPDLYDRMSYRFSTSTRLRFSEVSTGRVNLNLSQYEYSEGRDLTGESVSASVGLARELSPTLGLDVSFGYSKNREEEDVEGTTLVDEEQGPNARIQLTKEVSDGSYFGTFTRDLVEDTFRSTLSFGREISMLRANLTANLGVTALDGEELEPTFGLVYAREFRDGQFTASLRRTVTLNTDDEERTLTSAILGYTYEINQVSSFNVGFDYALVGLPGEEESEEDETRATLRASYSHALTQDWNMTVGYRARSKSTGTEDAFSNAVFVNLGRRFIVRP